mmetsp:Transcript_37281/g.69403  ORF Transcript_37281/g.69403 Transcript_37281/m.69403 type:complete len:549 (-) Transcript_37281:94-1740(-)
MNALSSAAIPIISDFTPQGLSNTSWAFARLCLEATPLMDALSAEVLARKSEFAVQNLASIAWAFSAISYMHQPFLEALASAAISTEPVGRFVRTQSHREGVGETPGGDAFGGPNIQSVLWSLWKMKRCDLTAQVYEQWSSLGRLPCVLELGLLLMESHWQKDVHAEPQLLVKLMSSIPVRLMRIALWKVAMVPDTMRPTEAPSLPLCDALGLSEQECRRYLKLARFVQYLECTGRGGSPEDIIEAVEWFPKDVGRWLKVAGGDKAVILWDNLRNKKKASHEVAVEFGALVGYTTVRLGAVCARSEREDPRRAQCTDVISVELDSCHACVARHSIDLAGLSCTAEVWVGQVRDLLPRFIEEFGMLSLGYIFMDQKGTAFHEDLLQLELMGAINVGGRVLADNCLKPGAPFFVWHVSKSGIYRTTIWTMSEFASEDIEDWMVVCEYAGMPEGHPTSCEPHIHGLLAQLAWETDNMRAGAERGALYVDDWVAFSQYVLRFFSLLGIEATPWQGLPEPEGGYPFDMPLDNKRLAERFEEATQAEATDLQADE